MTRLITALVLLGLATGCASAPVAPPPAPPPVPVVPPLDQRLGQVMRLEDQRWLDDGAGASLVGLIADGDVRVRRRAALAIGRIGVDDGVALLVSALGDADAGVRANAAFGLGLLKPTGARGAGALDALVAALADPDLTVRARVIDGLALAAEPVASSAPAQPGAPSPASVAATAIAGAADGCAAALATVPPDDEREPLSPELDVCRAALFGLTRLRQYDALARVAFDATGRPVSRWWVVTYALQRTGDRRAADALASLVGGDGVMTPALALTGLAAFGDRRAVPVARAAVERRSADPRLRIAAARALGRLKDTGSLAILQRVIDDAATPTNLLLEAIGALGAIGDVAAFDGLGDLFTAKAAPVRAAAMTAAARLDADRFMLLVSGIPPEKDWWVKGQLAGAFAALDPDRVRGTLVEWASEADPRLQAAALTALAKVGAADLEARLASALEAADFALRSTAANLMADRDTAGAVERLAAAYRRGLTDAVETARASAIAALATQARRQPAVKDAVMTTLRAAVSDPAWPVRLQAASILRTLGDVAAAPVRPAPTRFPKEFYESPALLRPPYSPHAFLETRLGTVEIELNVVEAPLTSQSFVTLARKGYFNGMRIHRVVPNFVMQTGDDRGDGEGGPGYALRDELSPLPYLRGTVGMALAGPDTGGSQFFITVTPQPHLNGKYAVFGQVVRGMEIVERLSQWDVIDRIRVWDGVSF